MTLTVQNHYKEGHQLPKRCRKEQASTCCSCAGRATLRKLQHNMGVHMKVKLLRVLETVFNFLIFIDPKRYNLQGLSIIPSGQMGVEAIAAPKVFMNMD